MQICRALVKLYNSTFYPGFLPGFTAAGRRFAADKPVQHLVSTFGTAYPAAPGTSARTGARAGARRSSATASTASAYTASAVEVMRIVDEETAAVSAAIPAVDVASPARSSAEACKYGNKNEY
jgi:hypothetical protein